MMIDDMRVEFFEKLIKNKEARILEIGPLNYPIVNKKIYPNAFYADIRSTEDVRKLYSGNDYLKTTGIKVDIDSIVDIDYVIKGTYSQTFRNEEKFDCVVASHVLEHMTDLIFALIDIGNILKPDGIFCIIYPDKRYSFDHFRMSASFRDAYHVFKHGIRETAPMVFDFYYSAIMENDPYLFWNQSNLTTYLPAKDIKNAEDAYLKAADSRVLEDVHYWPFSDVDFLHFLYDGLRAKLLPYECISFIPCMYNTQQFMVALKYDPNILAEPENAMDEIKGMIGKNNNVSDGINENEYKKTILKLKENEKNHIKYISDLESTIAQKDNEQRGHSQYIEALENVIANDIKIQSENGETIKSLEKVIANNNSLIEELTSQCEKKGNRILNLEKEIEVFTIQAEHHRKRIIELEKIEQSLVWKMIKPFRRLVDFIHHRI